MKPFYYLIQAIAFVFFILTVASFDVLATEYMDIGLATGNGLGPNGQYYTQTTKNPDGRVLTVHAGGSIATMMQNQEIRPSLPVAPQLLEFETEKNGITGGLTEFIPGTGIWITARHVLQQNQLESVEKSFAKKKLELKNYRFFEFRSHRKDEKEPLDVILAIPQGKENEILESVVSQPCACSVDNPQTYILKEHSSIKSDLDLLDYFWRSVQFGSGVLDDTPKQSSIGSISMIGEKGNLYLSSSINNITSPKSSGAIIKVIPPQALKDKSKWQFAGIVECQVSTGQKPVRVLSAYQMRRADVVEIPLHRILVEPRKQDPDCKPIDGRSSGGP